MDHPSPIFIPSRGTPAMDGVAADLLEHDAPLRFVIEPQDLDDYLGRFGRSRILIMGEDDRGPAYARNFIFKRAISEMLARFWIIDERVRAISRIGPRPTPESSIDVLASAESMTRDREDLAIVGFSPASRKMHGDERDVACRGVVCLRTKNLGPSRYIHEVGPFLEDDLTLQRVTMGWSSLRLGAFSYRMPREAPQPQAPWLAPEAEVSAEEGARAMIERWGGDLCRIIRHPDGRVELSIDWRRLRSA